MLAFGAVPYTCFGLSSGVSQLPSAQTAVLSLVTPPPDIKPSMDHSVTPPFASPLLVSVNKNSQLLTMLI